ncbi:MAG TPA: hopanoid-associated sugar epimerase [Thermoanaerobaculia bacterium]|nr:hopanoid-associated sugar epimerase [Thermoanaerobaculia bacterium]
MSDLDLVTGGTGFVGAHVVRALLARGRCVRCLARTGSSLANVEGLPVEIVRGDLREPASLARGAAGVDTLYHCAADYRLYARDPRELYAANVDGTENVLRAAVDAGVRRIVHTSSVATLSPRGGEPADETRPASPDSVIGHYKRSKVLAERVALRWAAEGAPVVVVNPSTPVGELDVKPTPTGRIVVDFLRRRMPAYVDTGLNLVDVRDVAEGHLRAAEKGRPGERYILGNRNMTLKEIFDVLAAITGLPSPRVRLPHWVPIAAAAVDTGIARLLNREPRVPLESARMARHRMYFDSSKAVRELGFPQSPVEDALARAVAWFRDHGYSAPARPRAAA